MRFHTVTHFGVAACCVLLCCAGHVPMLADPTFASMVQAIGQASLGADEKTIWHLTKVCCCLTAASADLLSRKQALLAIIMFLHQMPAP
jgi:hypothetical protein